MAKEREAKIKRFKEKKSLQEKIKKQKEMLRNADEEVRREYYMNMVIHAIFCR